MSPSDNMDKQPFSAGVDLVACETGNDYNGRLGLRISSIFVIMAGSMIATIVPILAGRAQGKNSRCSAFYSWATFAAKYFGSGVIIATAFIHLLAPAEEALRDECLTGVITEYPWVEGIILMTLVSIFAIEFATVRYSLSQHEPRQQYHGSEGNLDNPSKNSSTDIITPLSTVPDEYAAQLTGIFFLEFGIIFHSVFIGLTLAVAGAEFTTLYIVIFFHQTFEGVGLGSRLATIPWPKSKRSTPYILGIAYSVTTPIAIAIGLGVSSTYPPSARTTLIVNGVFDSISAGILIYTGFVELIAREFFFNHAMRTAPLGTVLSAFSCICVGAGLMALLGKWA
ncbi:hypothetical protein ASPSYDRAFT_41653 [Aspergillus sydowii CBS 593.65]|uniref:ZIP zinc/iron transport family n=1 Tax=Aspergillus sydowii CBS 593.65 TaxID=1036612 RepID=A0A1L9TUB7_9EURO|nr:uncharacterized protein ASPSYDRAFT_41653 [Aspergillus sydowii CBS 593.65]OJJ62948.1 hypothetical protein ASPSYDRAFT_41653 [Aspergillus sydowii CBS 593.65]